jgi:predicted ATPase
MLARALMQRGLLDQAIGQAQTSLEEALATDHTPSICEALRTAVCPVALMTGDLVAAERAIAMLIDRSTILDAPYWKVMGRFLQGTLLIKRGEFAAGLLLLRVTLDTCERTGWRMHYLEILGALAEGLAGLGRLADARAAVDRALERADRGGERWYVAELLRIKGELFLQEAVDRSADAERCFCEALDVARQQTALFWELRGALSLAGLRVRQDRQDDAWQVLAPVYDQFTEGFESVDLRTARALLEALPHRRMRPRR